MDDGIQTAGIVFSRDASRDASASLREQITHVAVGTFALINT